MIFMYDWRLAALATGVCLLSGLAAVLLFNRIRAPWPEALSLMAAVWAIALGLRSIEFLDLPALRLGAFSIDVFSLAVAVAAVALGVAMTAAFYKRRFAEREAEYDAQCAMMAREAQDQLRERNSQLDAALNNMSQALCMFDANRRLKVCNAQYAEVFGLPPELTKPGTPLIDILNYRVARGLHPGDDGEAYIRSRLEVAAQSVPTKSFVEFRDGRIFSILHVPMADGGWVATHEEVTDQVRAQRQLKEAQATLIEARMKAERAAAEAQAAHQNLLDACSLMNIGFVRFDADDRHVLFNNRYLEMVGSAAGAVKVGARFEQTLLTIQNGAEPSHETRREGWLAARLARHAQAANSEEYQLPDGRWVRLDERRTADGGSIGIRFDITDLKRREESFRLLFAANPAPMWVFENETARFLAVNDAAIEHYGYTREQFLAMTVLEIRPPEEAQRVRRHMASPNRGRQNGELWRHRKANGEDIDVAIYGRVMDYEGRPATLIAAIDVTNAQRAEAEAQRAREFLNAVFENVPAPIIVKKVGTSQMVLVNRAAETFLGASRAELIGKTPSEIYSGGEGAMLSGFDRQALHEGREFVSDEYRVDTPGNGVRFVTSKRVPILDESGTPSYLVTVINDITERKRANERIAHLSTHDVMTGLANREAFGRKLADAMARGGQRGVAAICIDLDRFKEINEVKGYAIGDAALRAAARRLQETAGETFIARVGGDEFSLVVEGEEQPAAAIAIADRLLAAFAEEIDVDDVTLKMGLSIGVAISPADGCDAPTLLANAEAALHRAKREGRGVARFFEAEMDTKLRDRRALQHELKSAIARGQLRVHYQPQANMAGEIFGFEALARWLHPTRGFVPPSLFIPLAEECGAIKEIGEWILREACREAASWPRPLSVSVNLSSVQFRQADLIDMIQSALVETGLSGRRLELEITESTLIDDPDSARAILRRIKALGVRIAMDDFGTGYSSLSYLQSFPFDKIKIDRSFIVGLDGNPQAGAIIRAVIGLAHGLHLPVIAEGVETKEQLAFLKREACDEMQGYLVGRPEAMEAYGREVGRISKGGLKVVA
jgi:diguanylate cyclase (GGDEF)-like protein/PAS domain S-box-containing protein